MKELAPHTYTLAEYEVDLTRRLLLRAGQSIPLNGKAFDLLVALIENRERVIAKEELMELVWPDQFVEEANLTVQISALRKALGEKKDEHRFIVTVPGRGYRFVADVQNGNVKPDIVTDIVFETRTTSHVLMNEEVVTEPETKPVIDQEWTRARSIGNGESGVAAYNPEQLLARQDDQVSPRNRLHIASLAALLGLVFLGGVGFWIYQSRQQNRQVIAALRSQQITMHRFTTTGGVPVRAAISPDGKSLVYAQLINGKSSLWLGQIETSSSVLIHQQPDILYEYINFSPDGGHIYFTMQDSRRPNLTLVRMPIVGGATTELISNVHSAVTFSPGGERIAFLRRDRKTNQTSIMIADARDGKNESTVATRKWPESFLSGLSWSPDGKTIAIGARTAGRRDEILGVSVPDGAVNKIGDRDWADLTNVAWLADGSGLVTVGRDRERNSQIWLVSYPGVEVRKITNDLNYYRGDSLSLSADGKLAVLQGATSPSIWIAPDGYSREARPVLKGTDTREEGMHGLTWTPGGHLLYVASVGDSYAIWEMSGVGSDHRQLIPHHAHAVDSQMRATADGRYLVFQSDRSGSLEIWRATLDGGDLKQLTRGGGNSQPSLSPDGRWVVYTSAREGLQTLWRIPVGGGEATKLTDSPSSWPQVSPDGKHIAYAQPFDVDPSEMPLEGSLGRADVRLMIIPFTGGEPVKSYTVPKTALLGRGSLTWTPDGKAIMYKDLIQGLWRQAWDEHEPQSVKGFEELRVYNLAWSFDGQTLAYTSGTATREIILFENFR
jgi:Tol biopolymer transport system component/DNA-binding winged helix-turn-helix (wHTH) protein